MCGAATTGTPPLYRPPPPQYIPTYGRDALNGAPLSPAPAIAIAAHISTSNKVGRTVVFFLYFGLKDDYKDGRILLTILQFLMIVEEWVKHQLDYSKYLILLIVEEVVVI
jgi:hypothetical protein